MPLLPDARALARNFGLWPDSRPIGAEFALMGPTRFPEFATTRFPGFGTTGGAFGAASNPARARQKSIR